MNSTMYQSTDKYGVPVIQSSSKRSTFEHMRLQGNILGIIHSSLFDSKYSSIPKNAYNFFAKSYTTMLFFYHKKISGGLQKSQELTVYLNPSFWISSLILNILLGMIDTHVFS